MNIPRPIILFNDGHSSLMTLHTSRSTDDEPWVESGSSTDDLSSEKENNEKPEEETVNGYKEGLF